MRVYQALRQPKTLAGNVAWHEGKKMPDSAFPLSRSHSYAVGRTWDWCVCDASDADTEYKILIAFDPGREQYRAWLGLVSGHDLAILARLEYHPTHRGWHCHVKRGECSDVARGVVKEARHRDRCWSCHAPDSFNVSQLDATKIAFRVFRVSQPAVEGGGLFG